MLNSVDLQTLREHRGLTGDLVLLGFCTALAVQSGAQLGQTQSTVGCSVWPSFATFMPCKGCAGIVQVELDAWPNSGWLRCL